MQNFLFFFDAIFFKTIHSNLFHPIINDINAFTNLG